MRVLILSCKTGGGHHAAGAALKERLEREGHEAVLFDYLTLAGKRTANLVGDIYVDVVKGAPRMFGFAYHLGMLVSRLAKKSPVYYVNGRMGKYLGRYLDKHSFDVIVMPHLYPAETISYMKKKGFSLPLTVAVMTDYTCIPFWEETDCDYYVIPHKDLEGECIRRGIPKEKLLPLGIPVSGEFLEQRGKEAAREELNLPLGRELHLIIGGSMGAGKIEKLTEAVKKKNPEDLIVVICGDNEKIYKKLANRYEGEDTMVIVGHTDQMPLYMQSCDIVYTKPGGLTSTEAAVSLKPLVHTFPIPGCETANREFFKNRGMALTAKTISGLANAGVRLKNSPKLREEMKIAQNTHIKGEAAVAIIGLLEEKIRK